VLSREFTGVGSFTTFKCTDGGKTESPRKFHLEGVIRMPSVQYGLGAILSCRRRQPECLELFTYQELWDGVYDGFSIEEVA
jgi:hypothetical protein